MPDGRAVGKGWNEKVGAPLTTLSDETSRLINAYTDELYNYLKNETLPEDVCNPMLCALLEYCPSLLRENYAKQVIRELPDQHKKAIIACHIASHLVYKRGLDWSPFIIDILTIIWEDPNFEGKQPIT